MTRIISTDIPVVFASWNLMDKIFSGLSLGVRLEAKVRGFYLAQDFGKTRRISVAKTMGISHGFVVTKLK